MRKWKSSIVFSAVAIFPLTGTILLSYRLAAGNALNKYLEKHNKFFGFVVQDLNLKTIVTKI